MLSPLLGLLYVFAWTKAKNCSSGNDDEVGEQMEDDDKSPIVPVRRSLRRYATPSEEESDEEEPDEEKPTPYKGPTMTKAPSTV